MLSLVKLCVVLAAIASVHARPEGGYNVYASKSNGQPLQAGGQIEHRINDNVKVEAHHHTNDNFRHNSVGGSVELSKNIGNNFEVYAKGGVDRASNGNTQENAGFGIRGRF